MVLALEKHAARVINHGETETAEAIWNVFGAIDESAAINAVELALPGAFAFPSGRVGYVRNITTKDIFPSGDEAYLTHEATVLYSLSEPKVEESYEYSFDSTGGESVVVTQAISTQYYAPLGRLVPDYKNGIAPDADGKIQGVAIETENFSFSITKHWNKSAITPAYQRIVGGLSKRVNNAPFGWCETGCCYFHGAVGKGSNVSDRFPLEYRFSYRAPETNIPIGDFVVANKAGFEHLSILRARITDTTTKKTIEVPYAAMVQQVIKTGNFALLNIL